MVISKKIRVLLGCLALLGFLKVTENVVADQPAIEKTSTNEEPLPIVKIENERYIMENLPPEMSGEENGQWIKELIGVFGLDPAQADIQYGKNSISFKYPCGCCRGQSKE